ncbi:MAG: RNA methyltransferase [Candidatus Cryptobacteroides sp.]
MRDRKLLNIELNRISPEEYKNSPKSGIIVLLDNIRSAHNIGSIFRTCDSFKIDKIFLCGICATPPSAEIHKSALGAEESVDWEYTKDAISKINMLKAEGYKIVSIEQTTHSIKMNKFIPSNDDKYVLIFGNEVEGVSQDIVDTSDFSLEIPQFGTKHSLNVSVCSGVVLWHFKYLRKN